MLGCCHVLGSLAPAGKRKRNKCQQTMWCASRILTYWRRANVSLRKHIAATRRRISISATIFFYRIVFTSFQNTELVFGFIFSVAAICLVVGTANMWNDANESWAESSSTWNEPETSWLLLLSLNFFKKECMYSIAGAACVPAKISANRSDLLLNTKLWLCVCRNITTQCHTHFHWLVSSEKWC